MSTGESLSKSLTAAIEHHQAGRLNQAEQLYRQILKAQPTLPQPWYLLGLIANQVNKPALALELFGHALALKPDHADAICERGTALINLGRTAEAIEAYERAIALRPDYAEGHYNLGSALLVAGQRDRAVACFRHVLNLKPGFADAHNSLG